MTALMGRRQGQVRRWPIAGARFLTYFSAESVLGPLITRDVSANLGYPLSLAGTLTHDWPRLFQLCLQNQLQRS